MTGSYLFNYESYYNGLMTDWGKSYLCAKPSSPFTLDTATAAQQSGEMLRVSAAADGEVCRRDIKRGLIDSNR